MSKSWIEPDMSKFAVLILCHGRPDYNKTFFILKRSGYTGRIYIIVDNLDKKQDEYIRKYGYENTYVFNKSWVALESDAMNNFGNRKAILFARNVCFDIAKELGYKYFQEMDDDYYYFGHKRAERSKKTLCYNLIAKWFLEFLINTPENVKTIAFLQGGDHIGGYEEDIIFKRKAMNSFFCMVDRKIDFKGILNEDVNAYVGDGMRGDVFLTFMPFKLDQDDTQQNNGGISELYADVGTYVKSFYSVMIAPSFVTISLMGSKSRRLHHRIDYKHGVPCIIREKFKKE